MSWDSIGISLGFPLGFLGFMGRRHDVTCLGTALAWHGLGMSRHVHAFVWFSLYVLVCPGMSALSRLVMSAIQGIHIYLHVVHVHTCARFGVKLGHGHVWHVACALYDML